MHEVSVSVARWSPSDVFSRTYTMFGLLMVIALVLQTFSCHLELTLILSASLPLHFFIEHRLSTVLNEMATSSSYFNATPYSLVIWSFFLLGFSIGVAAILRVADPFDGSLCSAYLRSLVSSVLIFLCASAFKCFALGTGLIGIKLTRRGFFAIFQRIFLIFRNFWILPYWIGYLCSVPKPTFSSILFAQHTVLCLGYLVFKAVLQLWLLWEFGAVLLAYQTNSRVLYTPVAADGSDGECVVCMDAMVEPVMLKCGHKFCYRCLFRWLSDHNFCPTCREPLATHVRIECADGCLPPAALFSAF
jgi:hypothetical protein